MNNIHIKSVLLISCLMMPMLAISQDKKVKKTPQYPLELGLHFGNYVVSGDVDHAFFPGYGLGLHLRKSLNNSFSLRMELFYGVTEGLDPQPSDTRLVNELEVFSGYGVDNPWFFAYQTKTARGSLQGILELTNMGQQKLLKNYNIYIYGGIGLNSPGTMLNLRDENNQVYSDLINRTSYNILNDFNTVEGRREIKNELKEIYDDTYETNGFKKKGIFRLGNETNIFPEASLGVGISRRFSPKINITIDHQTIYSDNDYLDGQKWRSDVDQSNNLDFMHYTSLRIAYNISKKSKNKEPQYWTNPWNEMSDTLDSLSALLNQYQSGLADDDQDGVINQIDQEANSKKDCPVDTKGKTLDSDSDGIVDCEDEFPYSNMNINETELANLLNDYRTNKNKSSFLDSIAHAHNRSIQELGLNKSSSIQLSANNFEYIYFATNSAEISIAESKKIYTFIELIELNKVTCLEVVGHTDQKHTEAYNYDLGLKRANAVVATLKKYVKSEQLNINITSKGESEPRIPFDNPSINNELNRRVRLAPCN